MRGQQVRCRGVLQITEPHPRQTRRLERRMKSIARQNESLGRHHRALPHERLAFQGMLRSLGPLSY